MSKINGRGEPDFCVPSFVLTNGIERVSYRRGPNDAEPWRYTLDGARHEIERVKRHGHLGFQRGTNSTLAARPNCVVRVYLK